MKLPKIKSRLKKKTPNLRKKHILFILIFTALSIILCVLVYVLIFDKKQSSTSQNDSVSMAEKTESRYAVADQKNLERKDYDSYQYSKYNYANEYIKSGDYKKARQILDEVETTVPKDSVSTDIYIYRAEIAKKEGKREDHKKYLEILTSELTKQGRSSEAEYYKKQLKELAL